MFTSDDYFHITNSLILNENVNHYERPGGLRAKATKAGGYRTLVRKEEFDNLTEKNIHEPSEAEQFRQSDAIAKNPRVKAERAAAAAAAARERLRSQGLKRRDGTPVFEEVVEYLFVEGYADTIESAELIAESISEQWVNEILESRGQDLRNKYGLKPGQSSSALADRAYNTRKSHRFDIQSLARNAEDRSQGIMPHGIHHDGTSRHRNLATGEILKKAVRSRGGAPLGSDSNPSAERDRGRTTHANFQPLTPQRRTEIRRMKTRKPGEGSVPKGNKHYRQFVSGVSQKDDPMDILKSASR